MCLRLPLAPRVGRIQQCITPSLAPNARWRGFPCACALASAFLRGELVTNVSSFYLPPVVQY